MMKRIPNNDHVEYDSMKQCYKDETDFLERLQNAIWPNTDLQSFVEMLDEGGKDCMEMRHGKRQETCLHRCKKLYCIVYHKFYYHPHII